MDKSRDEKAKGILEKNILVRRMEEIVNEKSTKRKNKVTCLNCLHLLKKEAKE